ncbi:MAG TPA: MarR family transcriptional regulator [Ruminococcaceae bacterium]|nr:MarR family transcriptional regulator [Oscillospiraceae bacterium]HAG56450.1 MarR family transcriptional regulator [Oscillospiraceae bacterium]HAO69253.1 MarR family transcriptional regulator [Oscillospiraceae bacterium]HCB64463.1 MarR family transcriptional regulator [Oscillospiraceae bacterium]HCU33848.1 MarR family transcriptional regulator [Oscillospiraceae bacterium]
MDAFSTALNEVLVDTYHNILRVEEKALKKSGRIHLSIKEMHLLEAVGKGDEQGRTVSEIADAMNITRPTATVAINKLEKRGYLEKQPDDEDGRTVRITLTRSGKRIDHFHRLYHYNMVTKISESLTDEEKASLFQGIQKLNEFLKESLGEKK